MPTHHASRITINVSGSVRFAYLTVIHRVELVRALKMTSRLKRKLGELGIDTSSRKANENFCLVRSNTLFRFSL